MTAELVAPLASLAGGCVGGWLLYRLTLGRRFRGGRVRGPVQGSTPRDMNLRLFDYELAKIGLNTKGEQVGRGEAMRQLGDVYPRGLFDQLPEGFLAEQHARLDEAFRRVGMEP